MASPMVGPTPFAPLPKQRCRGRGRSPPSTTGTAPFRSSSSLATAMLTSPGAAGRRSSRHPEAAAACEMSTAMAVLKKRKRREGRDSEPVVASPDWRARHPPAGAAYILAPLLPALPLSPRCSRRSR
ncbi:Os05g0383401 [Oryza sativa Japonica Group]|uniref:Os05g0383401 protein n=1 Tax=Oryza sativa subsp. japonica TaxID=39947 RepID=A0A0P0WLT3_ORYSJ|nr:Os05g0383401 [Oryza sativa Japonica Group]